MKRLQLTLGFACSLCLLAAPGCQSTPDDGSANTEIAQRPANYYKSKGRSSYNNGNFAQSVDFYETYVRLRPTDPEGRFSLGRALLAAGRAASARETLTIAYESKPNDERFIRALAEAHFATGDRRSTYDHLNAVSARRNTVEDFLRTAEYAERFGDVDMVEQSLLNAAALDRGETVEVQLQLSDFYGRLGDSRRQIRRLRMAYFIDSENQDVIERATALGEIIGPSWRIRPLERPAPKASDDED